MIMIIILIAPTILTLDEPAKDGLTIYGFPLQFYTEGGYCEPCPCVHTFHFHYALIDILLVFGIPIVINNIALLLRKRYSNKKSSE